jgi:hypothetical protein
MNIKWTDRQTNSKLHQSKVLHSRKRQNVVIFLSTRDAEILQYFSVPNSTQTQTAWVGSYIWRFKTFGWYFSLQNSWQAYSRLSLLCSESVVRLHNSYFCDVVLCENGDFRSCWKGMSVSPMSALVSISCAAVLDLFPLVACTEVHHDCQQFRQFCFRPFCTCSCKDAQIRSTAHRVLSAALWLLEQSTISSSCYRKNSYP